MFPSSIENVEPSRTVRHGDSTLYRGGTFTESANASASIGIRGVRGCYLIPTANTPWTHSPFHEGITQLTGLSVEKNGAQHNHPHTQVLVCGKTLLRF